jgi:hypothetical protein
MIQRCLLHGLFILLAVSGAKPAAATQADAFARLGDSAYFHKAYDSAEYYYTQAAAMNNADAVVLYKLGNAHFRLKHTGQAALAYERALKRRPGFADAAENLAVIQRRIQPDTRQDEVFFIRWWQAMTKPSRSNVWAVLGIVCFCIPIAALSWRRFSRRRVFWLWPQLIGGGILLGLLFTILAVASVGHVPDHVAVVMKQDAVLSMEYKGKNPGKPGTANLPEGLVVKVVRNEGNGNDVRVALPDGREGLVQISDIALVE